MYTDGHTLSRHCALPIYGVRTARQRQEVRATIGRFQDAFAAPFINKTQRNCGRILALSEIFPEAAFIRMHRDPFEMVRSRWQIYLSRGDDNRLWQSYLPRTAGDIVAKDPRDIGSASRRVRGWL